MNIQNGVAVTVINTIKVDTIKSLLVGAFEGGSNYWIEEVELQDKGNDTTSSAEHWAYTAPTSGGSITIRCCDEDGAVVLDGSKIKEGLQKMAVEYTRHFQDIINQNDDADTSDIFLQYCCFGEVVYG